MDPLKILDEYKDVVWKEVRDYFEEPEYPDVFKIPDKYKDIVEKAYWQVVKDYPERKGKYLRPTILILTAEAMGIDKRDVIKTAAAMQISEDWLLIHDDFQDKSLERRGKPTLQRIYGDELAVNAGDALHIIMWKAVFDNTDILGAIKTKEVADEFFRFLSRTTQGQAVEIKWVLENKINLSDEDWFFIADGKSAYYSVAGPARLGAIIANADKKQLYLLTKFGVYLGRCFQLVDDILDITSNFSGLKKQTGNDIYEGKRTIMLGHLLRNSGVADRKKLEIIIRKKRNEKTKEEVMWVINKMDDYGSISYAKELANKLKEESLQIFEKELTFLSEEPAREKLKCLINFVLDRNH
jgi:geranylgeranyl diphosphate synthase type II